MISKSIDHQPLTHYARRDLLINTNMVAQFLCICMIVSNVYISAIISLFQLRRLSKLRFAHVVDDQTSTTPPLMEASSGNYYRPLQWTSSFSSRLAAQPPVILIRCACIIVCMPAAAHNSASHVHAPTHIMIFAWKSHHEVTVACMRGSWRLRYTLEPQSAESVRSSVPICKSLSKSNQAL